MDHPGNQVSVQVILPQHVLDVVAVQVNHVVMHDAVQCHDLFRQKVEPLCVLNKQKPERGNVVSLFATSAE